MIRFLVLLAFAAAPQQLKGGYDRTDRVSYLRDALIATRQTHAEVLEQTYRYAAAMERGACASPSERLRAECLMTAGRRYCRGKEKAEGQRCFLTTDLAVSNILAERLLITPEQRYQILRRHGDEAKAISREIQRIQGSLAAQFRIVAGPAKDPEDLAGKIDDFCLNTAHVSNLSWEACAASLVWFIATSAATAPNAW